MTFTTGLTIARLGKISPSSSVKTVSKIGLKHIEFDMSVFSDLSNVLTVLKADSTTIHAPYIEDYGFDLSSQVPKTDRFVNTVINAHDKLKSKGVIIHPPTDSGGSIDLFYDRIEQLPGIIFLENMMYQDWNEFQQFFDETQSYVNKSLAMCFDIPHSYITHGEKFLDLPDMFIELISSSKGYIHLSGGNSDEDTHFPLLTEGNMPFNPIKKFLRDINFSGILTMELAPRSLEDTEKILSSYMIMLGVAGKRVHKLKVRMKKPFIMRKIRQLSSLVEPETFKKPRGT